MRKVNRISRIESLRILKWLDKPDMRQRIADSADSEMVSLINKEFGTTITEPVMRGFRRVLGIKKRVKREIDSKEADAVLTLLAACERKQQEQADEIERLGRNLSSALARITEMEKKFVAMGR